MKSLLTNYSNCLVLFILLGHIPFTYSQDQSETFRKSFYQNEEFLQENIISNLIQLELSKIWLRTPEYFIFGFIGTDYQRIRIKFISIIKNPKSPHIYHVFGKSMVNHNICDFQGVLEIETVYPFTSSLHEAHEDGFIIGSYAFYEDPKQKHVGSFQGVFASYYYLDENDQLSLDSDVMTLSNGTSINGFVGTWKKYGSTVEKPCHWGDYRIPLSGDLDGGAGGFWPVEKYAHNGWEGLIEALSTTGDTQKHAIQKERLSWWK